MSMNKKINDIVEVIINTTCGGEIKQINGFDYKVLSRFKDKGRWNKTYIIEYKGKDISYLIGNEKLSEYVSKKIKFDCGIEIIKDYLQPKQLTLF